MEQHQCSVPISSPPPPPPPPHVLIFPVPAQGHVNSMLNLAELLASAGISTTFLNSEHNHNRLVTHTCIEARFSQYPSFQFWTIPDCLPIDHPRSGDSIMDVFESLGSKGKPFFRDLLLNSNPPVNCIIGDGVLGFVVEIARELEIPIIHFRTISACCFWVYFCMSEMIEAEQLPLKEDQDMDSLIKTVPSMEAFLRYRDLPSFCQASDMSDKNFQLVKVETRRSPQTDGLIINTFEDLESPVLSQIRKHCPNVYTIGPLHLHHKTRLTQQSSTKSNSLMAVDRSCITWLDKQPLKSVIYVSFGSIATITRDELMEFWYGLINSEQRFLWVIRPDLVTEGKSVITEELTQGRGYMVEWAPQEEVLAHEAVGGFLTHSGWNSTLESVVAGVPMICWPYFADQQVNSRFVSQVWKLGLDMKDLCHRKIVAKMVRDLMVERRDEFAESSAKMARLARSTVTEGGSSYCNLDRLIQDIKSMAHAKTH